MKNEHSLWMGDIDESLTEEKIMDGFKHYSIVPKGVKFLYDKEKDCIKSYCFIIFNKYHEALYALNNINSKKIINTNKIFKLNWANNTQANLLCLYVGHLSHKTTDEELYSLFKGKYKSTHTACIIREGINKNISKGYGFVTFNEKTDYIRACKEMNGFVLNDSSMIVKPQKRKEFGDFDFEEGTNKSFAGIGGGEFRDVVNISQLPIAGLPFPPPTNMPKLQIPIDNLFLSNISRPQNMQNMSDMHNINNFPIQNFNMQNEQNGLQGIQLPLKVGTFHNVQSMPGINNINLSGVNNVNVNNGLHSVNPVTSSVGNNSQNIQRMQQMQQMQHMNMQGIPQSFHQFKGNFPNTSIIQNMSDVNINRNIDNNLPNLPSTIINNTNLTMNFNNMEEYISAIEDKSQKPHKKEENMKNFVQNKLKKHKKNAEKTWKNSAKKSEKGKEEEREEKKMEEEGKLKICSLMDDETVNKSISSEIQKMNSYYQNLDPLEKARIQSSNMFMYFITDNNLPN